METTNNTPQMAVVVTPNDWADVKNNVCSLVKMMEEQQKQIADLRAQITDNGGLMTEKETETALNCSRSTIYRMIRDGILHPVQMVDSKGTQKKMLRFRKSEVASILNAN